MDSVLTSCLHPVEWEGSDALEPADTPNIPRTKKLKPSRKESVETDAKVEVGKREASDVEESDDGGSEDEYVMKTASGSSKQQMPPDESSQDSDADSDFSSSKRPRRIVNGRRLASKSETPPARSTTKNKHRRQNSRSEAPAAKRSKTSATGTSDDPVRKYCLGQLEELITSIYLEYAIKAEDKDAPAESSENQDTLSDNVKSVTEQKAQEFVHDLEECLHKTYSERDKNDQLVAGAKYKERFRMLTFNLKKTDRVSLRSGIALGRITPSQLSTMSSTDLASEQTKHEIEVAEKEALEHSILKKMTAPRAKITRKGLEDIEDVNGSTQRDTERVKEEEAEERIERERLARLKVAVPNQSMTDSPATATLPSSATAAHPWGSSVMSPSLPTHEPQLLSGSPISARPGRPLFIPSASDILAPIEGDLNLADLINIDGDSPPHEPVPLPESRIPELAKQMEESQDKPHATENSIAPSGPSPFTTSQPAQSTPTTTSFDLNTLWNDADDKPSSKPTEDPVEDPPAEDQAEPMELDDNSEQASQDQDFDMFLGEDDKTTEKTDVPEEATEVPPAPTMATLPVVWNGTVSMPVNALSSMTPSVVAKQLSGQAIEPGSPLWKVLFPSVEAKIDGRVPVDKSSQYLLTTQLNVSKELICVCLEPPPGADGSQFKELLSFLVTKGRHALVFPWGLQPRPNAPGKELYLVPLLQNEPIPEFLELADDHHLPKERDHDLLIGVFVLNKGKLVLAPDVQRTLAAAQTPPIPPPVALPSAGPSGIPPPPPQINQNALAAEVASLTPEQIAIMLRHLNAIPPPVPVVNNGAPLSATSHPPFPPNPFPSVPYNPPVHHSPPPAPYPPPPKDYDSHHVRRPSWDYDHDDGRERGRGRGRGRSRGRGRGDYDRRSRAGDSGWGRRGGPHSPPRNSRYGP